LSATYTGQVMMIFLSFPAPIRYLHASRESILLFYLHYITCIDYPVNISTRFCILYNPVFPLLLCTIFTLVVAINGDNSPASYRLLKTLTHFGTTYIRFFGITNVSIEELYFDFFYLLLLLTSRLAQQIK
jgi:hypothetical protein